MIRRLAGFIVLPMLLLSACASNKTEAPALVVELTPATVENVKPSASAKSKPKVADLPGQAPIKKAPPIGVPAPVVVDANGFAQTVSDADDIPSQSPKPVEKEKPAPSSKPIFKRLDAVQVNFCDVGETVVDFKCDSQLNCEVDSTASGGNGWMARILIKSGRVKLSLPIRLAVVDASPDGKAHMNGHADVCRKVYESEAEKAVQECFPKLLGKGYQGDGADIDAAKKDAIDKASDELYLLYFEKMQRLTTTATSKYDDITERGAAKVSPADAAKRAVEEQSTAGKP